MKARTRTGGEPGAGPPPNTNLRPGARRSISQAPRPLPNSRRQKFGSMNVRARRFPTDALSAP